MAIFAGDAFGQFEGAAALFRSRVQRVTRQTFRRFFGFGIEFQDAGDAFADISSQRLIRVAVLVFDDPGRVFVLQNAAAGDGFDAAVAACGGAGAGADVFDGFAVRIGRFDAASVELVGAAGLVFAAASSNGERERQKERSDRAWRAANRSWGRFAFAMTDDSFAQLSFGSAPGALSFSRRGAKRQRASIYSAAGRQ